MADKKPLALKRKVFVIYQEIKYIYGTVQLCGWKLYPTQLYIAEVHFKLDGTRVRCTSDIRNYSNYIEVTPNELFYSLAEAEDEVMTRNSIKED